MQYSIFEDNMPRLERKLIAIKKKCAKYSLPFAYSVIGEEFKTHTSMDSDETHKQTLRYVVIDVSGTAIVNDWKFIASIEHTNDGNIIKCVDDSVVVPQKYYNTRGYCEHCGTNRRRRYTSLVMNVKTGEFKQLGKSCVTEYTHGLSAEYIANYISLFDELIVGHSVQGTGYERYLDVKEFLQYVVECVNCWGFFKSDAQYSTKRRAWNYMVEHGEQYKLEMKASGFKVDREGNKQIVEDALVWLENQLDNAYIHDLKVIVKNQYVKYANLGILASLIPVYQKEMGKKQAEQLEQPSRHIGEIGQRINIDIKRISVLTSWGTSYDGYNVTETKVYKIIDLNDNVFIWKTSSCVMDGETHLTGTVKEHSEYKGVKQTVLTRCKVA